MAAMRSCTAAFSGFKANGHMDKRYLKAGRYLIVDLDTGEAKKFTRYTGLEKRKRRTKFVEKHWKLCK